MRPLFLKARLFVNVVIDFVLFDISAAALNAFEFIIFDQELERLSNRYTAYRKTSRSCASVGSASPTLYSPELIFSLIASAIWRYIGSLAIFASFVR